MISRLHTLTCPLDQLLNGEELRVHRLSGFHLVAEIGASMCGNSVIT